VGCNDSSDKLGLDSPTVRPDGKAAFVWEASHTKRAVKYSTALRLGTAETEAILKRFSKNPFKHPTYLATIGGLE
jgi:TnpA family transposase